MQVEGYTDSTGSPAFNQKLSENRADSVKNFLVQNGVSQDNVTAQGYGATGFVAPNTTAAGRQQNRRVEMIVSGEAIGVQTVAPNSGNQQPTNQQPNAQQPNNQQPNSQGTSNPQ